MTRRRSFLTETDEFKCRYCGKQFPKDQKVVRTIIGRWSNNPPVLTEDEMEFCGSQCATKEQMSREG